MAGASKQLSSDKSAELSLKLIERSDQHLGKAILFLALAVAVGVWNVELTTGSLIPIRMTAANKGTLIGILGWVGAYHIVFAIMAAHQSIKIGQHSPADFQALFFGSKFQWPMLLFIPIFIFVVFAGVFVSVEMFEVLRAIAGR